jgi:hypothetical protein
MTTNKYDAQREEVRRDQTNVLSLLEGARRLIVEAQKINDLDYQVLVADLDREISFQTYSLDHHDETWDAVEAHAAKASL